MPVLDVSYVLGGYLRYLAGPPTRYPFPWPVTPTRAPAFIESLRQAPVRSSRLFTMTATLNAFGGENA